MNKAARPCATPGCAGLVTSSRLCAKCMVTGQQAAHSYDDQRGTAAQRGYGARWRRLRTIFLQANPLCCDPFEVHQNQPVIATDVDHVVPRRTGGTDDWSNLQPLCHSCHSKKTTAETGRGSQISTGVEHKTARKSHARTREIGFS